MHACVFLSQIYRTLVAGATANHDNFTTPANKAMSAFLSANDDNLNGTKVTYSFQQAFAAQVFAPGATTPQILAAGLVFNASGGISFNPAAQQLKPGTRVTFNYTIVGNLFATTYRSNVGVVNLFVTDVPTGVRMLPRACPMVACMDSRTTCLHSQMAALRMLAASAWSPML
jgi:plastocyanin